MGKKGKKTRWRRLPIGGTGEEGGLSLENTPPTTDLHRNITFNEDEYTKITTPRQDVLFKKGYLGRKRAAANPSPCDTQDLHSNDSVESESYVSEEPLFVYPPPTGYMDPTGLYYGNACEVYDPYTGTVMTMVVGPPPHCPGAPVLAAVPCQPVPLQPLEWAAPAPGPWCYSYNRKKRYSTDSQNCSAQSSESTGPPGSPQEPLEEACAPAMYPPQYVYPGYMFGPPVYTMNGVTVQGMIPQPVPMAPDLSSKRRKKRRRRRRGGVTDDGSESSCCEEACMPGDSSDAGSKGNSDSGIHTDPTPSPPLADDEPECVYHHQQQVEYVSQPCVSSQVELFEELSTTEDDVTPNLCAPAPEFSSQECTLSCSSSPSFTKDITTIDVDTPTHNAQTMQEAAVSQDEEDSGSPLLTKKTDKVSQDEDRVCSGCPLTQETDAVYKKEDQVCYSCPMTTETDKFNQLEDGVGDICPLPEEADVVDIIEEQACNSCPMAKETDKLSQVEDRVGPLTQEAGAVDKKEDQVCNSCPVAEETDKVSQAEDRLSNSCTLAQEADTVHKNQDQECNSCPMTEGTNKVCLDEYQAVNSCSLIQEAIVNDQTEICLVHESNYKSSSISLSPETPDPLLLDSSSDDLIGIHEYEEVPESINTKEILVEDSNEELSDEPNLETLTELDESPQSAQFRPTEAVEPVVFENVKSEEHGGCSNVTAGEFVTNVTKGVEASSSLEPDSRFSVSDEDMAPVPPPRRKRSMCKAADKLATRIVEEAIREGVEEAGHSRLSSPLSITEAVTRWLNSHESSPLTCRYPDTESEDEEGVEAVEDTETTGQKNVRGNPFPVPSHNGVGQRVAKDCDSVTSEWDFGHARDMCDPARSVDKYYRLGADGGEGDRMPPSVYKTAVHIRHNGPFPCGVCCIIQ